MEDVDAKLIKVELKNLQLSNGSRQQLLMITDITTVIDNEARSIKRSFQH